MNRLRNVFFLVGTLLVYFPGAGAAQSLFDDRDALTRAESVGVSTRLGDVTLASFPSSDPQDFLEFFVDEDDTPGGPNTTVAYPVAGKVFDRTVSSIGYFVPIGREVVWRHALTTGEFNEKSPPLNTSAGDPWPVTGDWNGDGYDELGIFDRDSGVFERFDSNYALIDSTSYAIPGFYPFIGDWDQDGRDDFGAFNASTLQFRLYDGLSFTTVNAAGVSSGSLRPVAGDWNGNGEDSVGACSENDGKCYLFYDLGSTASWDAIIQFGTGLGSVAIAGRWDSDTVHRFSIPDTPGGSPLKTFPIVRQNDAGNFSTHVTGPVEMFPDLPPPNEPYAESMYFIEHTDSLHDNRGWIGTPLEYAPETGATALGAVLDDDNAVFKHPNGTFYRYISYFVTEHPQIASVGGWACLRYSQNGTTWTDPIFATTDPLENNPRPCLNQGNLSPDVPAELMTAMWDGVTIITAWFNGDNNQIVADFLNGVDRSHTFLALADPNKPWYFDRQGEVTTQGIQAQTIGTFDPYAPYGVNLDYSYDPIEEVSYFSRTYPYPFDINGSIPCATSPGSNCSTGISTNPNRVQLYRFEHQGVTLQDKIAEIVASNPTQGWELVYDIGSSHSYPYDTGSGCFPRAIPPTITKAVDVGLDINSASLVKDRNGFVHRFEDGKLAMTLGGAIPRDRAFGECDFGDRNAFSFYFDPGPKLETGRLTVGAEPVTVRLANTYLSPVVVATVHTRFNELNSNPVVTRVSNVTPTSFQLRLQSPSVSAALPDMVSYVVVEEGSWLIDGVKVEAQKYVSTVTDHDASWVGEAQAYEASFTSPVVVGQVMSESDPDFSVFWSQGASRTAPPSASTLVTGKTVAEDPDITRADETIGFIVFEAGHGSLGGVEFEAGLSPDTVQGAVNGAPFDIGYTTPFSSAPLVTVASMAGVDGANGGWAQIHWSLTTSGTATEISLSIDEDTLGDAERGHTTEQVGYLAFVGRAIYPSPGSPVAEWGTAMTNDSAPHRVYFSRTYDDPVVVATIHYENNVGPMVPRISNITNSSFEVRLQSPSGGVPSQAELVSYLVVEAGDWIVDGVRISASKYTSTVTDEDQSWVGQAQTYGQSFTNPVVLGQVMSENDPDFSVFWNQGSARTEPPSATALRTGKTVCEDTDVTRSNETVGIIVIETVDISLGGVPVKAALGPDTVRGFDDNPPFTYTFPSAFATAPEVALATMAGVDGANGGWAYVFGTTATSLFLAIDEDLINDFERNHTTEQVGYVVFASPGSVVQ